MNWFVYATIGNFGVGPWFFGSQPAAVRTVTGVAGAFLLCFLLAGITAAILALIYGWQRRVRHAAGAILVTIICMVTVRELVRRQTLAPWFSTSDLEVVPQYSPLILFLLIFAAGLYLVWWMIRLVLPADKEIQA
jgi:di/tricarboxylate transporter